MNFSAEMVTDVVEICDVIRDVEVRQANLPSCQTSGVKPLEISNLTLLPMSDSKQYHWLPTLKL